MPHRANWLKLLAPSLAVGVFVLGAAVTVALAKQPNPPKNTQLPNGRPFQIIEGMFGDVDKRLDDVDKRLDTLESAAPKGGTMWINPLDLNTASLTLDLAPAPFASPGLVVGALAPVS